jgi:hypothetical protein
VLDEFINYSQVEGYVKVALEGLGSDIMGWIYLALSNC